MGPKPIGRVTGALVMDLGHGHRKNAFPLGKGDDEKQQTFGLSWEYDARMGGMMTLRKLRFDTFTKRENGLAYTRKSTQHGFDLGI